MKAALGGAALIISIGRFNGEGVGALLHVSALVAILAVTFLRLDHNKATEVDENEVEKKAEIYAKELIKERALRIGNKDQVILKGKVDITNLNVYYCIYVLCVIAKCDMVLDFHWRLYYYFVRQRDVPLLVFFRRGCHVFWAFLSLIFSGGSLFLISFGEILDWEIFRQSDFEFYMLLSLLMCFVSLFLLSAMSSFQKSGRLKLKCRDLSKESTKRMNKYIGKLQSILDDEGRPL